MIKTDKWLLNPHFAKVYQFPPLVEQSIDLPSNKIDEHLPVNSDPINPNHTEDDSAHWNDYQESFDKGYKEGKDQGFQSGLFSGEEEGKKIGFAEGVKQGREEGFLQGKHTIDNKLIEVMVPLMALKSLLEEGYDKQINQQQQLIVDLVRRVTQQVIRCELALQPQQILTLVEETIASLPNDATEIEIHLEPSAVKELQLLAFDKLKDWKIVPDPEISQGGCRIVTNKCDADASIETRLDACIDKVKEHLTSSPDDAMKAVSVADSSGLNASSPEIIESSEQKQVVAEQVAVEDPIVENSVNEHN